MTKFMIFMSLTLNAAIFGFFYAWVCSTMWGLDRADPRVAIQAMQAMNDSVRNFVFAPAFFGTPVALAVTALLLLLRNQHAAAAAFAAAAIVYSVGAFAITVRMNVPMNESLATVVAPEDIETAHKIWAAYSDPWQMWNQIRAAVSGVAFLIALYGVFLLDFRRF